MPDLGLKLPAGPYSYMYFTTIHIASDKELFSTKKYWYFFYFLHDKVCCGDTLNAPHWDTSNKY